jgi:hypothetical protein
VGRAKADDGGRTRDLRLGKRERYLHARPATELADRFTVALGGVNPDRTKTANRAAPS